MDKVQIKKRMNEIDAIFNSIKDRPECDWFVFNKYGQADKLRSEWLDLNNKLAKMSQ